MAVLSAALGIGLAIGLALVVQWDAARIDMERPRRWASVVFATVAIAVVVTVVLGVPPAGAAALGFLGPAVYLFEREDATAEAEPGGVRLPEDGVDPVEESEESRS